MMKKLAILPPLAILLFTLATASAQRPATAPATAPSGKPPDTVLLEELTWAEVRDLVKGGTTTIIIGTAGTEQKGPHMVDGEHKFVMEYTGDKIARGAGENAASRRSLRTCLKAAGKPTGHMSKPGTITLPEERFVELLGQRRTRASRRAASRPSCLLGESGGNRTGMRIAADKLNELWKGSDTRAFWVDDYYTKVHADQNKYVTEKLGVPADKIGGHANILDTSEMLFVNPKHVRKGKLAPGGGYENSGVSGDPTKSTAELGKVFLQIKIDNALAQIKGLMAGTMQPSTERSRAGGGGRGGRGGRARPGARRTAQARPRARRPLTAPAGTPSQAPDTVFIDELTWEETRDAIKAGKTTVIVPTGGTEKNGYHMVTRQT